ncbi:hypothetical protein Metev_0667 [Methanohalobium evestigatum Z-7303]|uniref:Uncharacterized protein n=1 Tax=Methanohalobium evestigatum (strain ATCC BAA-1072 / DSM 3721 / NBRC 107634 / OCM 161 / Z-7303) TaxID=644295 RepID=D7E6U9_METEZ|nr:hypothetical protein [Methanohalobium evestigatum]ADI73573.1 hypothetical protein Metev_0667 [Methanohalobium evestigatum Z-7303]
MVPSENWLKDAILNSKLPKLIPNYKVETILTKTHSFDNYCYPTILYDILTCSFAICGTGDKEDISNEEFEKILYECMRILELKPTYRLFPLNHFGLVQNIRPPWYSIPIYKEILKPFSKKFKLKYGVSIEYVFEFAEKLSSIKNEMNDAHIKSDFPKELSFLINDLTVKISDVEKLEDIWDKLFVQINDNYIILLDYKVADNIYLYLNQKLGSTIKKFGKIKGDHLEDLVEKKLKDFLPNFVTFKNYYINEFEKDILVTHKKMGFCIECKSVKIRPSSFDWSKLNLKNDIKSDVSHALNQISKPLNILSKGGKIIYDNKSYKIKPKNNYYGLIITDQIYTPLIREALDELNNFERSHKNDEWHGKDIWIGSFIDFTFLLQVSQTPSILLDFLKHIKSIEKLKYTDEPESWLFYCMEPVYPYMREIAKNHKANIALNDFGWDDFYYKGAEYYKPIWLDDSKLNVIHKYDKQGLFPNSFSIINQCRDKTYKQSKARTEKLNPKDKKTILKGSEV